MTKNQYLALKKGDRVRVIESYPEWILVVDKAGNWRDDKRLLAVMSCGRVFHASSIERVEE